MRSISNRYIFSGGVHKRLDNKTVGPNLTMFKWITYREIRLQRCKYQNIYINTSFFT